MKVRFVQFEAEAFLTDMDFIRFSAAEKGLYCTLLFYLYANGGKCEFDPPTLQRLANCENFGKLWENIAKKFQTRKGVIKHKRVTKELRKAKQFLQAKRRAGLASAAKRNAASTALQHSSNTGPANETKRNVIEKESKALTNTNTCEQALSVSNSVRPSSGDSQRRALYFNEALTGIIGARTRSDRTCFRNVTNWLIAGCAAGKFNDEIFARVLDLAKEARTGRNPAAVFMALLKKELRYKNE